MGDVGFDEGRDEAPDEDEITHGGEESDKCHQKYAEDLDAGAEGWRVVCVLCVCVCIRVGFIFIGKRKV